MRCLSIQLQPERDQRFKPEDLVALVKSLGRYPEVDRPKDDDRYVNLNFFTEEAPTLWQELQQGVLENDRLGDWVKQVAVIVCEAEQESEDYLLLYSFEEGLLRDSI